jgi:hypothetical protein
MACSGTALLFFYFPYGTVKRTYGTKAQSNTREDSFGIMATKLFTASKHGNHGNQVGLD